MQRVLTPEMMDDPNLDAESHHRALVGLRRLNALSYGSRGIIRQLKTWSDRHARPLRVLDLATGSGDGVQAVLRASRSWRHPLIVDGCDVSQVAVDIANDHAKRSQYSSVFFVHDVLKNDIPDSYDVVMCSLFLHHLELSQIQNVLLKMQQAARVGVIVNDLVRSRWNLAQVWLATRLVTRSPVVHFDGPTSVRAALTVAELRAIVEKLGWCNAEILRQFPARMLLTSEKRA
jgi:2-polyprenyl-3-methyl-5-hydroxy-6-metoxy-1,4-benzoquinol methylase